MISHSMSTADVSPIRKSSVFQTTTNAAGEPLSTDTLAAIRSQIAETTDKLIYYPGCWDSFVAMLTRSGVVFSTTDPANAMRIGGDVFGLHCYKTHGGVLIGSSKAMENLHKPRNAPKILSLE